MVEFHPILWMFD
jgi:hypothetical protein